MFNMTEISIFEDFEDKKSVMINKVPADIFEEIKSMYTNDYYSNVVSEWIKIDNILFFKEISKE